MFFVIPIGIHSDTDSASRAKPASRLVIGYKDLTDG